MIELRLRWRPVLAVATLALATVAPLVDAELGGRLVGSPADTLGAAVAGFLVGAWLRAAAAAPACLLGALAMTVANQQVQAGRYTFADDYFFFALLIGTTALAGALIAGRRRQVRELRRLSAIRESQQADEVATAQLDERLRLEAEVTDAVMQRMSALVVQAAGARRLSPGPAVRVAAAGMEQAARAVADDLRATVGSLRAPVRDPDAGPVRAPTDHGDDPTGEPAHRRSGGRSDYRAGDRAGGARPGWVDVLIAGSGLPLGVELLTDRTVTAPVPAVVLAALLVGAPLLLRRTRPLLSLTGMLLVAVITSSVLTPLGQTASVLLPVSLAAYAAGAHTRRWGRPVGIALLVVGTGLIEVIGRPSGLSASEILPTTVWLAVAVLSGVVADRQSTRAVRLRELLALTEAGADSRLRLAVAEQRQTVARDLHDGVALAVTVITLQARVAGRSADPAEVAGALEVVEASAREAMTRLRDGLATLETPERAALDAEVSALAAWLGVRLRCRFEDEVPAAVRPLVRRVIREALINIARHAPDAQVEVRVGVRPHRVTVEVIDSGSAGAGALGAGTGTGLLGLAEAVHEHGGRLEQGRTETGGFRVAVRLPLLGGPVAARRLLRVRSAR